MLSHRLKLRQDPPERTTNCLCVAYLAVLALGAGFLPFAHDHSSGETLGHHCALCHAQHAALEPATVAELTPERAPGDRISAEMQYPAAVSESPLHPPLRGPPSS